MDLPSDMLYEIFDKVRHTKSLSIQVEEDDFVYIEQRSGVRSNKQRAYWYPIINLRRTCKAFNAIYERQYQQWRASRSV